MLAPEAAVTPPSSVAHLAAGCLSFENALVRPSCTQLRSVPRHRAQQSPEVQAASLGFAAELLVVAVPVGLCGCLGAPGRCGWASPGGRSRASGSCLGCPCWWGSEVTPSRAWKCLKSQVGCVAETFVQLVRCHRCLVVDGDSTAQLLWNLFSLVRSLVQHRFSADTPKSVP